MNEYSVLVGKLAGGDTLRKKKKNSSRCHSTQPNVQWTGRGPNPDFYRDTPSANGIKSICNWM